jgi:glycine cleavage system H lipoate-binding protein
MTGSEFLSAYPAKLMEYALAVGYLLLFVPFWRYLHGGRPAEAVEPVRSARPAHAGAEATATAGWFTVPEAVLLHPGHTWARPAAGGLVEVGLDDFAARLLGPVDGVTLPSLGSAVEQGMPALEAFEGGRRVGLLSPVDGTVAEVNTAASWLREPYGAGWLFKVRPERLEANRRQLLAGEPARQWLQQAEVSLAARLAPGLGEVLQDGGTPVHGIARELEPERWDALCREYFRS